jgi:hypothetical protein
MIGTALSVLILVASSHRHLRDFPASQVERASTFRSC